MEFIDMGGNGSVMDAGQEMQLHFPPMRVTVPLLISSAFMGEAPIVVLDAMWRKLWPESHPGPLLLAAICAELTIRKRSLAIQDALAEATRPN